MLRDWDPMLVVVGAFLVVALVVLLVFGIPASIAWDNECEKRGGQSESELVAIINNVQIWDTKCYGPNGELIEW